MPNNLKSIVLTVLLSLVLLGLGVKADDSVVTSGSSAGNETTSSSNELAGFSQAVLKEEITKNSDNLDSSNTQPQFIGNNTLHVKVDSSGTESFSEAGQTKTIKHFITWDSGDLFGYFCMGYLRISYDASVVDIDHVTSGAFSTGISRRGTGWIIVDPWMWFSEDDVPESDPNRLAFSITWKCLQAGTTTFTYTITNSSGTIIRNYFLTGTVHNMQAVPAVVQFAPQIQPPATPSNLVATAVSSSQINLTWQDNSDNEQGFYVERKAEGYGAYVQVAALGANVTAYSDTGLTPETLHYYRVRAYNQSGNSDYSNEASATTPPELPAAPTNLIATPVSPNQINLAWTDNSYNENGFIIESKTSCHDPFVQIATVGADITTYSNTNLLPGTVYYYRVCAYNQVGNSAYSNKTVTVTFADIITAEKISSLINDYYQQGEFKNKGVYNSLSVKITHIQQAINQMNYQSALEQLKALTNEINALNINSMSESVWESLYDSIQELSNRINFISNLPATFNVPITNESCINEVVIEPLNGGVITTALTGYVTVKLNATNDTNTLSVTILHAEYTGSSFNIGGINFGTLSISDNLESPSTGTLNLINGQINILHKILVRSPYLDSLGISPVPIETSLTGTLFPADIIKGHIRLVGMGTIPSSVPLLNGATFWAQMNGEPTSEEILTQLKKETTDKLKTLEQKLDEQMKAFIENLKKTTDDILAQYEKEAKDANNKTKADEIRRKRDDVSKEYDTLLKEFETKKKAAIEKAINDINVALDKTALNKIITDLGKFLLGLNNETYGKAGSIHAASVKYRFNSISQTINIDVNGSTVVVELGILKGIAAKPKEELEWGVSSSIIFLPKIAESEDWKMIQLCKTTLKYDDTEKNITPRKNPKYPNEPERFMTENGWVCDSTYQKGTKDYPFYESSLYFPDGIYLLDTPGVTKDHWKQAPWGGTGKITYKFSFMTWIVSLKPTFKIIGYVTWGFTFVVDNNGNPGAITLDEIAWNQFNKDDPLYKDEYKKIMTEEGLGTLIPK